MGKAQKTKRRLTAKQREFTAYHEAGHAVAAVVLKVRITRKGVSIVPGEDYLGIVHHGKGYRGNPELAYSDAMTLGAERRAIVALAGPAAQRKFRPSSVRHYHGHSDRQNAIDLMSHFSGSNRELNAYMKLLYIRAQNFVANPLRWKAIQAVAKALLERDRLSADEVEEITHCWPPGWIKTAKALAKAEPRRPHIPDLYEYPVD